MPESSNRGFTNAQSVERVHVHVMFDESQLQAQKIYTLDGGVILE
jgi:hypothetical protein